MAPAMRPAAFLLTALTCAATAHASPIPSDAASVGRYFSYDNAAADTTVDLIENAQRRVLLAGYAYVPPAVAAALRAARARGIEVRVVLARSSRTGKYSGAGYLKSAGIDVAIDSRHGDPAPRFVIVDDSVALTTLSDGAAAHADTVNVFHRAPELAQSYAQSFWRLYRQAGGL
ncbi:phospholipase D-like domain-containing protein [Burkholderia cepacia]|uniref:phospholipase D n=1 Tax=Burkholderia cepacia GG4 TaxID=1009846 RepID=A0A9W3K0J2_BURCE|nr:phospholipase D-like domain-containing protein [Burkholderia cepacia]AFQ48593.1 phosphatidylserine phosphatidylglycerophosphate cardiolipin synthase [Burkholderia cepacia GG4]